MRVVSMIPDVQYEIQQSANALSIAEQQVSTGLRVQQLSDDPSASASMVRSLMESSTVDQYTSNVSALQGSMQTASSALSQVVNELTAAISSGTAGANSSLAAGNRQAIAQQLQGSLQTVVALANTSYEGSYLFGGSASGSPPYVQASSAFVSANGSSTVPLSSSTALTSGSVTTISDAATGQTLRYTAQSGDTLATLQSAIATGISSGTISAGTSASINASGQFEITQPAGSAGLIATTTDPALGALTAESGAQVANSYAYVGNDAVNTVQAGASLTIQSNIPGSTLFGSGTGVLSSLSGLIAALQGGSNTDISSATNAVSSALNAFDTTRVPLDESIRALNSQESYLSQEKVTLSSQQTSLTGISTAEAATNLAQAELDNNAVLAAAAKALPQTLLQYL